MPRTLQFWPRRPQHTLVAGERTLAAGETFEASDEDAEGLLAESYIREPPERQASSAEPTRQQGGPAQTSRPEAERPSRSAPSQQSPQTQSPGRAERQLPPDRRDA